MAHQATIALAGNPNSGKTTLFNQLTGAKHRIANYPGITVSHTFGNFRTRDGRRYTLVDLPGTYSIEAHSPEEVVTQRFILGDGDERPSTDLVCVVVDATNLERNLYLASQLTELSIPAVVALNMMDLAESQRLVIDVDRLSIALGVPVVPIVAASRDTLDRLEAAFRDALDPGVAERSWGRRTFSFPRDVEADIVALADHIRAAEPDLTPGEADFLARKVLGGGQTPRVEKLLADPEIDHMARAFAEKHPGLDLVEVEIQARYAWIRGLLAGILLRPPSVRSATDRADRIVLHRFFGPAIMAAVFCVLFVTVFVVATYPMEAIDAAKGWLIGTISAQMGAGELRSLITDGILEGMGAVVVFLPQIMLLFLVIALLEDFGYMARAAFILDRFLSKVGLSGRAFVPLLSSFACAIPGVLATRTIPSRRERFLTIMIAPLMVCSARLPVYSLLIAAFVVPLYGPLVGGLVFLGMYALAVTTAALIALFFGRTILRGGQEPLILELPAYRRPVWRNILSTTWDRTWDFLRNAGTIILAISIVLWFLASHPRDPAVTISLEEQESALALAETRAESGDATDAASLDALRSDVSHSRTALLESSFAGRLGRGLEPALQPLGLDWKVGVAIVTSFAAREVFVGTLATIYGLSEADDTADHSLAHRLRADRREDGTARYSLLTAITLLIFYAFTCQCMSTLAVVARETRSVRWPLFLFGYMSLLAFTAALLVYQGGRLLGWS